MDRNQKFLKKLSIKEFYAVEHILQKILVRDTSNLDIKKLSSYKDVYRVRVGSIRVIFLDNGNHTEVLEISRRSEKTYKDF
jgi:mRNA-degrading endonuclease RelE of RelBE toxin-antitoxin system